MTVRTLPTTWAVVPPAERPLRGVVRVPGDKSVSHRAAMLAALADGWSEITGFSPALDCEATVGALRALGVGAERRGRRLHMEGRNGFSRSLGPVDCRRSGTTMRLLAGLLAAEPFPTTLIGDDQLLRRPLDRIAEPLRAMGTHVDLHADRFAPMRIRGGALHGIEYTLPVASAQVKSAVVLAALRAVGPTVVVEPVPTRDHTERLLEWLGADIVRDGDRISVAAWRPMPFRLTVPGDVSSAAPILAAAAIVPGSDVVVEDVGLNPTRTAFVQVLARMGATVDIDSVPAEGPEPAGTVRVRAGTLRSIEVTAEDVPNLIDELPLVATLGAFAHGTTVIRGAHELRVKESDRIATVASALRSLGASVEEFDDGLAVHGPSRLHGGACETAGDHRIAIAAAVAALGASSAVRIEDAASVADSFPGFFETLERLR